MFGVNTMQRFFGLDIHKDYLEIAAVDEQGELLFSEKVPIDELAQWVAEHLTQDDSAILEAGTNTWWAYDTLKAHVRQVLVTNPIKTRLIAEASFSPRPEKSGYWDKICMSMTVWKSKTASRCFLLSSKARKSPKIFDPGCKTRRTCSNPDADSGHRFPGCPGYSVANW